MNAIFLLILKISYSELVTERNYFTYKGIRSKSAEHIITLEGFYKYQLKSGDSIKAHFNNSQYRMFIFIEKENNFEEIIVDNKIHQGIFEKNGIIVEGKNNCTIKFKSSDKTLSHFESQIWLLKKSFCPSYSIYAKSQENITINSIQDHLCIFSPIFGPNNSEVKINFNSGNDKEKHVSRIYSNDFKNADKSRVFTDTIINSIDSSSIIRIDYFDPNSANGNKNEFENENSLMIKCDSEKCHTDIKSRNYYTYTYHTYTYYTYSSMSDSDLIIIIVSSVISFLFFIVVIIIICYACSKRHNRLYDNINRNPIMPETDRYQVYGSNSDYTQNYNNVYPGGYTPPNPYNYMQYQNSLHFGQQFSFGNQQTNSHVYGSPGSQMNSGQNFQQETNTSSQHFSYSNNVF